MGDAAREQRKAQLGLWRVMKRLRLAKRDTLFYAWRMSMRTLWDTLQGKV